MVVRKVQLNHQLGENYICFSQIWCHSFGPSLHHGLDLESVYQHILPGSAGPEVTTLHSQVGATVDYIFYNPRRNSRSDEKGRRTKPNGVWTDFILRNLFFNVWVFSPSSSQPLLRLREPAWDWLVLSPSSQKMSCGHWRAFPITHSPQIISAFWQNFRWTWTQHEA